jgi:hypothetical protein
VIRSPALKIYTKPGQARPIGNCIQRSKERGSLFLYPFGCQFRVAGIIEVTCRYLFRSVVNFTKGMISQQVAAEC